MNLPELVVARDDLRQLLEYSSSLPTGTTVGKRWRRAVGNPTNPDWAIGEYWDDPSAPAGEIGIRWFWAVAAPGNVHRGKL